MKKLVQCEKGHYYDPSKHSQCPTCAGSGSAVSFGNNAGSYVPDAIGATTPLSPVPQGAPMGALPDTMPVGGAGGFDGGNAYPEDTGHTVAADVVEGIDDCGEVVAVRPVCGWLVCIEGGKKGQSYEIYTGVTSVGRGKQNDIVLDFDKQISETCLNISYDVDENEFNAAFAGGTNLIKLNKKSLLGQSVLCDGDIFKIGKSYFIFRALCNDDFKWDMDDDD
ncbi:MAG: FHA domain-containing protein [Clostridia bacterium]|nr:FHA domain-containing protein [Clostridia bacterium]